MNSMLRALKEADNYTLTENGATSYKSTLSAVYDMFALCGSYRNRSEEDCILMFKNALEEDANLAIKCLFYLGDVREGQGERRYFRVCFNWLANNYPSIARKNIEFIPYFKRWDDVIYSCVDTPVWENALSFIKKQLILDLDCKTPSLLAKWLPSENASSATTKELGNAIRNYLGLTHKQYRVILSTLRSRINVLEKLMSENKWDQIKFDSIPSKAGLKYKNAFAKHDVDKRYEEFAKSKTTKVNADTLYPYEIVQKAIVASYEKRKTNDPERLMIEKYWNNKKDYFCGNPSSILAVIDTSGSMTWSSKNNVRPIDVAISLGIYCAERAGGPFKDHYISFSSRPQLIKIEGIDFTDKVERIYKTNLCENTDITATFDMLLEVVDRKDVDESDIPQTIVIISDMEIDQNSNWWYEDQSLTEMEKIRKKWKAYGYKLPNLVYWNVCARNNLILDKGEGISFVSGCSPVIFESVITGKTGWDLCLTKLLSKRYEQITA